jgi:hypothetical protein
MAAVVLFVDNTLIDSILMYFVVKHLLNADEFEHK